MIKIALLILASLVLSGCVTIPITVGDTAGGTVTVEILKSNQIPVLPH